MRIILLVLLASSLYGQVLSPLRNKLDSIEGVTRNADNMIVSNGGLNTFFGKKVAYYLTGSSDLSLYKSYFTIDTDGEFFLAYNIANSKKDGLIVYMSTWGIKANLDDGLASFFKDGETSGDIGVSYTGTFFFPGTARFDNKYKHTESLIKSRINSGAHKAKMNDKRLMIKERLKAETCDEENKFLKAIVGVSDPNAEKEEFREEMTKKYINEFSEQEADKLDQEEAYNAIWKTWFSWQLYIPVTPKKYEVAGDFIEKTKSKYYLPFKFSISYNGFVEGWAGKFFGNLSLGIQNSNSIVNELTTIDEVDVTKYKNLGGTDTLRLAKVGSEKVFIGAYTVYVSPSAKAQIIWYPWFLDFDKFSIGLNGQIEKFVSGDYQPLNLKFGVPIRLSSDDSDKPINIELNAKFFDYSGIVTDKAPKNNLSIGVSVGLPFLSLVK